MRVPMLRNAEDISKGGETRRKGGVVRAGLTAADIATPSWGPQDAHWSQRTTPQTQFQKQVPKSLGPPALRQGAFVLRLTCLWLVSSPFLLSTELAFSFIKAKPVFLIAFPPPCSIHPSAFPFLYLLSAPSAFSPVPTTSDR